MNYFSHGRTLDILVHDVHYQESGQLYWDKLWQLCIHIFVYMVQYNEPYISFQVELRFHHRERKQALRVTTQGQGS